MSSTHHCIITPIYNEVAVLKPLSVLDVGVGFGRNGVEMRNFIEAQMYTRIFVEDRVMRIEGIEIFEKYRNPIWDFIYDEVHIGNAKDVVQRLSDEGRTYDLVIMTDLIEHLEKADGEEMLGRLVRMANHAVIVSHPYDEPENLAEREIHGNPAESHVSLWSVDDYRRMGIPSKEVVRRGCYALYNDDVRSLHWDAPELVHTCHWYTWQFYYSLQEVLFGGKTIGEELFVHFTGYRIQIVFVNWQYGVPIQISLDGETPTDIDLLSEEPGFLVYQPPDLPDTNHSLRIVIQPRPSGEEGGCLITRILVASTHHTTEEGKQRLY